MRPARAFHAAHPLVPGTRSWPGWMHPAGSSAPQSVWAARSKSAATAAASRAMSSATSCAWPRAGCQLCRAEPAAIPARADCLPGRCQRVPWPQCPGAGPGWLSINAGRVGAKSIALGAARNHWADGHGRHCLHCPAVLRQAVRACCNAACASPPGLAWHSAAVASLSACALRSRPVPAARRGGRRCLTGHAPCHKGTASRCHVGLLLPFVGPVRAAPGREAETCSTGGGQAANASNNVCPAGWPWGYGARS